MSKTINLFTNYSKNIKTNMNSVNLIFPHRHAINLTKNELKTF